MSVAARFVRSVGALLLLAAALGAQGRVAGDDTAVDTTPTPGAIPFERWKAPEPQTGELLCGTCETSGREYFERDPQWEGHLDERTTESGPTWRVLHDSELYTSDNYGLDWTACDRRKAPSIHDLAEAHYAGEVARRQAWLDERRRVDAAVRAKQPLVHIESTHFVLAWGIPKVKTSAKKTYRMHAAAMLYLERFEQLYAEFQTLFELEDRMNQTSKHFVYLFERQSEFSDAAPRYTGLTGSTTVQRMSGVEQDSSLASWWDKGMYSSDDDYRRHLSYSLIKHFTSDLYDLRWFEPGELGLVPPWLNDKYGWLDTGLCHWFELRLPGNVISYSMREQDTTSRWKGNDWRKNILKAAKSGDVPTFAEVITLPTQSLTAKENQFVWSWIDFLLARDTPAMGKALAMTKQEYATRDILKECWGLSVLGFEQAWTDWVLVAYAPTKR